MKKELVGSVKVKKDRIDEEKAADSNGDPWLQVRCRQLPKIGFEWQKKGATRAEILPPKLGLAPGGSEAEADAEALPPRPSAGSWCSRAARPLRRQSLWSSGSSSACQVRPVSTLAELPVFHPKVAYPGVPWSQREQQWWAQGAKVGGAKQLFRIRPHSEAELERPFRDAMAWKKKQEKSKGKETQSAACEEAAKLNPHQR
eukprot:Skav223198  [mRNA]  locus=scaffold1624:5950:6799:- [translate_table: standard]